MLAATIFSKNGDVKSQPGSRHGGSSTNFSALAHIHESSSHRGQPHRRGASWRPSWPHPGFGILTATERHAAVAAEVIKDVPHLSGNLMHDAQTAVLMREHGIKRIYTRDTDFHRFPFVDPVDPVA